MSGGGRVAVVGDATLDVVVRATAAAAPGGDRAAAISLATGGQGANVAIRLARRSVPVRLVTALGDDAAGAWIAAQLAAEGVELAPFRGSRSSLVAVLLDADGERTMLSDRIALAGPTDRLAAMLAGSDWIHCSGYPLRDPGEAALVTGALAALGNGPRISVAGGSVAAPPEAAALGTLLAGLAPDLLVMGLDEARALAGERDAAAAAVTLRSLAAIAVVTAGAEGAVVAGPDIGPLHVAAPPSATPVVDTTGAGDAFLAALIAELIGVAWPPHEGALLEAVRAGALAGSRAARVPGAQGRIPGEAPPAPANPAGGVP